MTDRGVKLEVFGAGFHPDSPPDADSTDAADTARANTCAVLRGASQKLGALYSFTSMGDAYVCSDPNSGPQLTPSTASHTLLTRPRLHPPPPPATGSR